MKYRSDQSGHSVDKEFSKFQKSEKNREVGGLAKPKLGIFFFLYLSNMFKKMDRVGCGLADSFFSRIFILFFSTWQDP